MRDDSHTPSRNRNNQNDEDVGTTETGDLKVRYFDTHWGQALNDHDKSETGFASHRNQIDASRMTPIDGRGAESL